MLVEGSLVYVLMAGNLERRPRGVLGGGSGSSGEFFIDGVRMPPGSGLAHPGFPHRPSYTGRGWVRRR